MHYEYKTKGTCSSRILFDIEDGKLKNVEYIGGIRCGYKPTSCPDQLATALEQATKKA